MRTVSPNTRPSGKHCTRMAFLLSLSALSVLPSRQGERSGTCVRLPRTAPTKSMSIEELGTLMRVGIATDNLVGYTTTRAAQLVVLQRVRSERGLRPRHGSVRALDGVPEDGVQDLGVRLVGPIKGQFIGVFGAMRVLLIDLTDGLFGLESVVGHECGRVAEGGDHWRGCGVELTHRWETEDEFDGPQHRDRGVHAVIDDASPYVQRGDQAHGAVRVDMVRSVLRIVLNDEDGRLSPDWRAGHGLHNPA